MRQLDPRVFVDLPAQELPSNPPKSWLLALKSYPQSYPQAVV